MPDWSLPAAVSLPQLRARLGRPFGVVSLTGEVLQGPRKKRHRFYASLFGPPEPAGRRRWHIPLPGGYR